MDFLIKICGIARYEDAVDVAALKPDAMGFVLWPGSPRYVKPADLIRWLPLVSTKALKVGVFVDPDPKQAIEVARAARLDVVQVHGTLDRAAFDIAGIKLWQALYADRVSRDDISARRVDAYVADTYSKELPGGTGKTGNWEAVRALVQATDIPVILAGGLRPENVREAIRVVHPWGVDVSSGVEKAPGHKDMNQVRDFIIQCRTS